MRLSLLITASLLLSSTAMAQDCKHRAERNLDIDAAGLKALALETGSTDITVRGVSGLARIEVRGRACASSAELLDRLGHTLLDPLGIGNVATQAKRLDVMVAIQVLHQAIQSLLLQIQNHQARPGLGKTQDQRPANTGTTTGNQDHLALEHLAGKHLAIHG